MQKILLDRGGKGEIEPSSTSFSASLELNVLRALCLWLAKARKYLAIASMISVPFIPIYTPTHVYHHYDFDFLCFCPIIMSKYFLYCLVPA